MGKEQMSSQNSPATLTDDDVSNIRADLRRIADAAERIAAALERAYPERTNTGELWSDIVKAGEPLTGGA